jgi:hypothetical protein
MSEPLGPVIIGPREIYDAVVRLTGAVERIGARQDVTQRESDERHREVRELQTDHEARLRSVERGRWPLPAVAILLSLITLAITVLPILSGGPRR